MTRPDFRAACDECAGPLGAYSLRCPFCDARIGKGEERKRVRRVLFAFDRLLAFAALSSPSLAAAGALGFGLAMLGFGVGYGVLDLGFLIAAPLGVALFFAVELVLLTLIRRARHRERARLFEAVIRPNLIAFMNDRGLAKQRFDEIARSSLGRAHPLHRFVPW